MFILIDEEEMEIVAKHPNYGVLCDLGCIQCPDDALVVSLDHNTFHQYNSHQLEMLYIGLTGEVRAEYPELKRMQRLMGAYANELDETLIVREQVSAQADYALTWGIEGYCSFVPGKFEPSDQEGLWQNQTVFKGIAWEQGVIEHMAPVLFKNPLQEPWR